MLPAQVQHMHCLPSAPPLGRLQSATAPTYGCTALLAIGVLLSLLQLYTAKAPFAGHHGYGHWLLDGVMDQIDFWRELAALGWYGLRGWL
jgi:hypothetical protein